MVLVLCVCQLLDMRAQIQILLITGSPGATKGHVKFPSS